jgi:glycosyltransferase involved in cell wall biosynthesis
MKLSVVIPCFNGADTLGNQLDALSRQHWCGPWEVVVADNGSTDDSMAVAERYRQRLANLRIVDASKKRGQPYALNVGAHAATGDALLFCDADDEVAPGWLAAMGEALLQCDFVACRLSPEKLNASWLVAGRGYTQQDGLQKLPYPPYLPHAGGGTLGVKRSLFEAVGGFDEELPAVHDAFFCWRAQLAGTPLRFVPDGTIYTRYRHKFRGMYRQARSYGQYSVFMYKKARALGTPKIAHPWREGADAWRTVLKRILEIRSRGDLAWCIFKLGYRVGRIRGSIKHRILAI